VDHKYKETVLFFPSHSQTCHAYCTYCFRWPQFVDIADNPYDMLKIPEELIADTIYPVGFWRKKAKSIKSVSEYLVKEYEGQVPDSFDKLIKIKGIGSKTAKIVLESAFGESVAAVDTHMHRILNILGYIDTKTPNESDKVLEEKLPTEMKKGLNRVIVSFGQVICKPLKPKCDLCPISEYCPKYKSIKSSRL